MIQIEFTTEDVARTRFALSPLWEVVASVRVLKSADEHGLHQRWTRRVRRELAASERDFGPLFDLVPAPARPPRTSSLPSFLCPPPVTPLPSLAVELAGLRATPPQRIRTTSDVPPERIGALRADPSAALGRLSELIEDYWELALAPYWSRILGLLESDIAYRARRLVEGGAQHLFADLDPQVTWDAGTLQLAHRAVHGPRGLDSRGLLLVPSAFVWPRIFSVLGESWQPALRYPPRGVGTLWSPRPVAASEALCGVLGRSRALLLAELVFPTATIDLARRTGLTPGGASQHLTTLRAAGLVSAHRSGRKVLYVRTSAAETLLAAAESN